MSAREWKSGDVALVMIAKDWDGRTDTGGPAVAIRDNVGSWACGAATGRMVKDKHITNARPLVVIDPEDRKQVEAICWARWTSHDPLDVEKMQAALRSLITPPKPEEPTGLGAVVEDDEGLRWLRHSGILAPWHRSDAAPSERAWRYWDDIAAVKILSEGVQ